MRRTPTLTKRCQALFEEAYRTTGWVPGGTVRDIAEETGLSTEQVLDAVWGAPADAWRRRMLSERREGRIEDAG